MCVILCGEERGKTGLADGGRQARGEVGCIVFVQVLYVNSDF